MLRAETAPAAPVSDDRTVQMHALVVGVLNALLRAGLDEIDDAIEHALAQLGQFCEVDRTYVFTCRGDGDGPVVMDNSHEWVAEGIEPAIALNQGVTGELLAPWWPALDSGGVVELWDAATLPEEAPVRAHLLAQSIRSLLLVPMRRDGRVVGLAGFDAVRAHRAFSEVEKALLISVADGIQSLLERRRAAAAIARTQHSLAEARNRLQATLDAMPDLVIEVDAEGRYVAVHTADADQLMAEPDHFLGRRDEEVLPRRMLALSRQVMAEVDASGRSGPHLFKTQTGRGLRWFAVTAARRAPDRPGEAPGYVFVTRDVTEERELQAEMERLSLIARNTTDLVVMLDVEGRVEWVNPAFEARTGWPLQEARGQTPAELLHCPDTDRGVLARLNAELAEGKVAHGELLNRTRHGELFWTEVDMHPLMDAADRCTGYVCIETDITARKAQEAALESLAREATDARLRLETAVEALPDAFAFYDAEDRLVLCNSRHRELYPNTASLMVPGVPFTEILRAAVDNGDIVVPRDDDADALVARRLEAHSTPGTAIERQLANGTWMRVLDVATHDGGRVAMAIDVTELKQAERRLADIIDGAEAGTWEWTLDTGENLINERWATMLGYTLEDLSPLTIDVWRRLAHPEDLAAAEKQLERVHAGELGQFGYDLRMRHRAGHWVWVASRGRVVRWDARGRPAVMSGVHMDITELKRAQERLEEILGAAAAGTWEFDFVLGTERINDRWAEMLGYTHAELAGRPHCGFPELVHPEDLAMLQRQHVDKLCQGEDSFANELRMRHKDGHWLWVLSRGRVVARDPEGRPAKTAGIHVDITDRKRLEAQLMAERDYLARMMETSVAGIVALDADGAIIFANREAESILGLEASRLQGRRYNAASWRITALDGGPLPDGELPFSRALAEGRTVRDIRFAIARPGGQRRALSVNAAPIRAEGLDARVVCSIVDITEQVGVEAELRAAALRAEAASRAKSQFLANMSHEIRTPLNGVLGMAEVLEGELSAPRHRRMLATIRESGEMLLGIVNDVLDVAKIEAGKLQLESLPVVPADLARRVEAIHAVRASEKGLALSVEADAGAERARLGDAHRIQQVLHNLVSNAVKFTEAGSVCIRLRGPDDGPVELVVADTGIGMTPEQLARVFEDFEQADGTTTRRFGGTGLGMSIVRRLVGLMSGEIAIDSRPGAGTEVRVVLPLALAAEAPRPDEPRPDAPAIGPGRAEEGDDRLRAEAAAGPGRVTRPDGEAGALAGLRALAADDNATNRLILQAMLGSLGVEVTLVNDGRAAVEAWAPGRFDLLLLDISMPELDGVSALAELRACEAEAGLAPVPALAITANALSHQVEEYMAAGFAAHVGKPFRREDLAGALSGALTGAVATAAPSGQPREKPPEEPLEEPPG